MDDSSLTDEQMYARMKNGWRGGLQDGTVCGGGSTMEATVAARKWLPDLMFFYDINSVCDAGAGDLHWQRRTHWKAEYTPFDLIPRMPEVTRLDICKETLPKADAILCRHVLNHLDSVRVAMAIERFRESGARYLIATQFDYTVPGDTREFCRLDLRPLLGAYLEAIDDGGPPDSNCKLAIWNLQC